MRRAFLMCGMALLGACATRPNPVGYFSAPDGQVDKVMAEDAVTELWPHCTTQDYGTIQFDARLSGEFFEWLRSSLVQRGCNVLSVPSPNPEGTTVLGFVVDSADDTLERRLTLLARSSRMSRLYSKEGGEWQPIGVWTVCAARSAGSLIMSEHMHAAAPSDDVNLEDVAGSDETTPTQLQRGFGVRRVNNLPVIIVGGIILGFVAVIAVVAAHRAAVNAPKPAGSATPETVADKSNASQAEQMAASISRKAPAGIVAPAFAPPPLGLPADAVGIISASGESSSLSPPAAASGDASALQQERARVLVMKRTQLEEAIKAPTHIAAGFGQGFGTPNGAGFSGGIGALSTGAGAPRSIAASDIGPQGAGSGVTPSMLGQLNGAHSQMEIARQRAVANAHLLTERLNQLSQEHGAAPSANDSIWAGTTAGVGEGMAPGTTAGGYAPPSMPVSYGASSTPSASSRPALLTDAVAQFDGKEKDDDRWSLNSAMSVPRSVYELRAGAVIPAILISGVNSELPGAIIAQLSENVYDTARGNSLLLPQGSRLIGEYTSNVGYGQSRLMVVWKRIVFPDAKALDIGAMPGTSGAGYGGMKDQVNNHYVRLFAGAVMLSAIEAAIIKSQPQSGVSLYPSTSQALDQSLGNQLGMTATQLIQRNMNIAPTLNIRPGYRLNVMVTKDMVFSKPYQAFDY